MRTQSYSRVIFKIITVVLFAVSAFTLVRGIQSHISFLEYPYQLEFREGAALEITETYLSGKNPFDTNEQPQSTYVYGFVYPLTIVPFTEIFGNTLSVHRVFTFVFMTAACLIIFLVLLNEQVNLVFAFSAFVILLQSFLNAPNTMLARPEGVGIFLLILGTVIPWRFNFSSASLAMSIVIGIAAYFTKPYYILLIPDITIYLFLFVSKKKSIYYLVCSAAFFLVANAVINFIYPLYLNNTFLVHKNAASYLLKQLTDQLELYFRIHLFVLLSAFAATLSLVLKYRTHSEAAIKKNFGFNPLFRFLNDESVFRGRKNLLFTVAMLMNLVVFVILLGGHEGNYYGAYLYHLVSPFLILVLFLIINGAESNTAKSLSAILLIAAMLINFTPLKIDYDKFSGCFKILEKEIFESKEVFNTPETVSILIGQDKPVYNSGHSEYFYLGSTRTGEGLGLSEGVSKRLSEFYKEVNEKVRHKDFDLILQTADYGNSFIDPEILNQNYRLKGRYCAPVIYDDFTTEIWIPK